MKRVFVGIFTAAVLSVAIPARGDGFLYQGGTITKISFPGAADTNPAGINDSGQIVGSFSNSSTGGAFLDSGGVFTTFGFPGADQTYATGINDPGQIVG